MTRSLSRIQAMFLRYAYLHKRSLPRTLEIVFWPVMELLVWGFVVVYIRDAAPGPLAYVIVFLINAMIFWDILYRSQQAVTIPLMEDIWTQNITNLFMSPLRIWEWLGATFLYGLIKVSVITTVLGALAFILLEFNLISELALYLIPLVFNLLLFGWTLGVFTAGLLIRWGYAAEALVWGIPFLIQPISAIYYPVTVLPPALELAARSIPSTYVFEGMRAVLATGTMPYGYFWTSFVLNILYFIASSFIFNAIYKNARETGRLGRLGLD